MAMEGAGELDHRVCVQATGGISFSRHETEKLGTWAGLTRKKDKKDMPFQSVG